jgi:AcrR family transcriptional regulator
MKKTSKQEWLAAGLQVLTERGVSALRIEYLCEQLQVSKGSFYHHFQHMEHYIVRLMECWQQECTTRIIEQTEQSSSLAQKTETLNELVLEKDQKLEVVIRAWAVNDIRIQQFVSKVDQQRLVYLQQLYQEKGIGKTQALDYARLEYAALVGMQQLFAHLPVEEWQHLFTVFQQFVSAHPKHQP